MKILYVLLGATLALSAALPASAQGSRTHTSEYERNKNILDKVGGTHESRSAERKATRARLKSEVKAGAMPDTGEDYGMNKNLPAPVAGSHASRSAQRKVKRQEIKEAVRSGEMPVTTEAEVARIPAKP